jgi:large subunit ribosomal protein L3
VVTQLKTATKDGYDAAQIGLVEFVKASKVTKPQAGHFAKTERGAGDGYEKEVAIEVAKPGAAGEEAANRWREGRRSRAGGHFFGREVR